MNDSKCGHCPLLTEDRECPGQKNSRVCVRADPKSELHTPGILAKILSFGTAVVRHVAAGAPRATEAQKDARLAICRACEHFEPEKDRCRVCGCGLSVKASWADQGCPIGKWPAIIASESSA